VEATEVARELGPYWVVSADNPFSQRRTTRRTNVETLNSRRSFDPRPHSPSECRARPFGNWPDERGFAIFGTTNDFVRHLAVAFDQFAFYFVDDVGVRVERCDEVPLALGERHGH